MRPSRDSLVSRRCSSQIYLDISDDIKFAWKIQRDMAERGHSLESIKSSIEARKPDFDAYIDPQKKDADMIIQVRPTGLLQPLPRALLKGHGRGLAPQCEEVWGDARVERRLTPFPAARVAQVLPTQLVPDDKGQYLRVRLIQKEGSKLFDPVYLFDEGSTISWIPCGRKLTCSFPGADGTAARSSASEEQRRAVSLSGAQRCKTDSSGPLPRVQGPLAVHAV
jgi:phosphoribulokinase